MFRFTLVAIIAASFVAAVRPDAAAGPGLE